MDRQARASSAADLPGNPFERGIYFLAGRGGQTDFVEAHKWFNIAAARGTALLLSTGMSWPAR
jgi:TPR repeat protein